MKKLSQLLESINEVNSLLELDFTDKKSFQKYQAKHKMKPTTKINIAGKETTVGDEMGDDSQTPQAPKKTTGADIEKQASKSGKEKSDIEKDIMGDEPKSVKLNSYAKKALSDIDVEFEPNEGLYDLIQKNDNIIRNEVVKNIKNTEDFNGYIRNLYSELEEIHYEDGTISQEELSTLEGLKLSDETFSLSDVPQDELVSKTKQLGKFIDDIRYRSQLGEVKNENFDLRQLSKITTRYTNRLDEAGVSNHLRANFKKLKNVEGLSIEERDELTDAYRKLVDLLTYGKFYENGKPNQRRKELSELTFDIQYALVGSKRLKPQNSQSKFESIWKKFTNMINTQIKIEEKGKRGNYIKAIRASQLDDVVDMFKRNTKISTRKQKDLL